MPPDTPPTGQPPKKDERPLPTADEVRGILKGYGPEPSVPLSVAEGLAEALEGTEQHACHLLNRARSGTPLSAELAEAHATGMLKRVREALADYRAQIGESDE